MANVSEITLDVPPDYGANYVNNSSSSIPTITGQYPPQPSTYPPAPYGYPPQPMSVGGPVGYYPPPQPQQQPIIVMQQMQQQQQQQQQTTVIVNAGYIDIFRSQKILACFVIWLCNCPFGLTAWILAMVASSTHPSDPDSARRLGKASLGVSISGIIVTVIVICVACGLIFTSASYYSSYTYTSNSCSGYTVSGVCYSSKRYVGSSCSSYYSSTSCCSSYETYYNYYCYTI